VIDSYYKNKVYRLDGYNLGRILEALNCQLTDILTVTEE
jgi:DNA-binding Xre family transcriptional regulator